MGRFTFTTHGLQQGTTLGHRTSRFLFPALQGKEWYRTRGFKELALVHGVVEGSYRKTTTLINRVRHQSAEEGTPVRTLCDTTEGEGQQILAQMERHTDRLLKEHHFTREGTSEERLDWGNASETLLVEGIEAAVKACDVAEDWKEEMADNPVSYEDPSSQVYAAIDGVGVKKQKEQRQPDPPPKRPRKHPKEYVYTTLAQVDHDEGSYVLVGSHTVGVLRLLLAFLLDNGLWQQGLTFLTDGQKTLQGAILRAFSNHRRVAIQNPRLKITPPPVRCDHLDCILPCAWSAVEEYLHQIFDQPSSRSRSGSFLSPNPFLNCLEPQAPLGGF